jgi:hypothetical protein
MAKNEQDVQNEFEVSVVERMCRAKAVADQIFGTQANNFAVEEITFYLEANDDDEEDFLIDLARVYDHTKVIYAVETPSPEQVFGVFNNIFDTEEEED